MQRGGPGLGNISGSQGDYFQSVKGGGHGDYKMLVYAPSSLQELWDLTMLAFDKADEYRNPAMILGDGVIGQMMEPFSPSPYRKTVLPEKNWILDGCKDREPRVIKSLYMGDGELEMRNAVLQKKYHVMKNKEVRYEQYGCDDAECVIVAFGIVARIALASIMRLRRSGCKVGLFRPITLFPFPHEELFLFAGENRRFLVVEMNAGQMVEDVRLAIQGRSPVSFYGRPGGAIITPEDVETRIQQMIHCRQDVMRIGRLHQDQ
jgi:2-oxoglutarate ferredoxin oxidoreductase subunit alpha